jgi:hypothetical protein
MRNMWAVVGSSLLIIFLSAMFTAAPSAARVDLFRDAAGFGGFDRWECEAECRRIYGGEEWAPPRLGEGGYFGYASCIQRCERKYWKSFDKESDDLLK